MIESLRLLFANMEASLDDLPNFFSNRYLDSVANIVLDEEISMVGESITPETTLDEIDTMIEEMHSLGMFE